MWQGHVKMLGPKITGDIEGPGHYTLQGHSGKCHFLPGGGAPENWEGSGTLSKIKRGDQKIFQIKKDPTPPDHLYF